MTRRKIVGLGLGLVLAAFLPAGAGFGQADPLAAVRALGYRPLGSPTRRGNTWIVDVEGRSGRLRLVIDARTGNIIGQQSLDR